jgi:hypothetical protein
VADIVEVLKKVLAQMQELCRLVTENTRLAKDNALLIQRVLKNSNDISRVLAGEETIQ